MALVKITVTCPHCKVDHEEYDPKQYDDRETYLAYWNLPFEGPEADAAWKQKQAMRPRPAPTVIPDIAGHISMADGSWIDSRSKHRAHLKQHRMIESTEASTEESSYFCDDENCYTNYEDYFLESCRHKWLNKRSRVHQ